MSSNTADHMLPSSCPSPCGGITRVRLTTFRSYEALALECTPKPVVLTGKNGAGKTNLLEALSYLAPGRGLRGQKLSEVALMDEKGPRPSWYVTVDLETQEESLRIGTGFAYDPARRQEKRVLKIGGEMAKSQTELNAYLNVMWLVPQMDGLFQGSSGERRKFLDRLIPTFDPEHTSRVYRYEHALRERSRLLKQGITDPLWFKALEETMAESGVAIAYARQEAVLQLSQATDWAVGVFPQAALSLEGPVDSWIQQGLSALEVEERLREALSKSRAWDGENGSAKEGPHRTDLKAYYREKSMPAASCSTGEQKALLLSLIIAATRVQSTHRKGVPLVLLDEVVAHLDEGRREALYEEINHLQMQVWMTGTDFSAFAALQDRAQYFMVEHSQIFTQE